MRGFLRQLDGLTGLVALLGALCGAVWIVSTGIGVSLTIVVLLLGTMLLLVRRRWIEIGVLFLVAGGLPALWYRLFGEPPDTLRRDFLPIEAIAPGGATFLAIIGLVVLGVAGLAEFRDVSRREHQEARHLERRASRTRLPPS